MLQNLDTVKAKISYQVHLGIPLICKNCGVKDLQNLGCRDRTCVPCGFRRQQIMIEKLYPVVQKMEEPMFLTLTKKRVVLSRDLVSGVRNSFTYLRHKKVWTARGGLYNVELGTIQEDNSVNLHLHSVLDGSYMPQAKLKKEWKKITLDSHGVDIRWCKSLEDTMWYVTKHFFKIVKPEKGKNITEDQREYIHRVLKNTHLIQGYGSLFHLKLLPGVCKCPECDTEDPWISRYDEDTFHDVFTRTYCARYPSVSSTEKRGFGGV